MKEQIIYEHPAILIDDVLDSVAQELADDPVVREKIEEKRAARNWPKKEDLVFSHVSILCYLNL